MPNLLFASKGEGDVVQSSTFNLTRVTTWLASLIGALTAISGANADPVAVPPDKPPEEIDWFNFNAGQRTAIVIALIAAVAIVHAADLLARSLATSRVVSSGVHLFPAMRKATKRPATTPMSRAA